MARSRSSREAGFTLIELMIVEAIMGVMASIVSLKVGDAIAHARFARVSADLDTIRLAALQYYDDHQAWAPDVWPDVPPDFVPQYLQSWPKPPCPGLWNYDWANWLLIDQSVRITLRDTRNDTVGGPPESAIFFLCLELNGIPDCSASQGSGVDITKILPSGHFLRCTE